MWLGTPHGNTWCVLERGLIPVEEWGVQEEGMRAAEQALRVSWPGRLPEDRVCEREGHCQLPGPWGQFVWRLNV